VVVFISLRAGVKIIIEWQMKEKARKAETSLAERSGAGRGQTRTEGGQNAGHS
jgi:hypothetical protein